MNNLYFETEKGIISLPDKTRITYEQNAPFFDRESLRNSFTNTFKVQGTNNNLIILNIPDLLEDGEKQVFAEKVILKSDDVAIENGILQVNEARGNLNTRKVDLNCLFSGALSEYSDLIEGKSIRDLQLCGIINIDGDDIINITNATTDNIRSKKTTDFATDVVLNGHNYICFPTLHVDDEHYDFVNLWDDVNNEVLVFTVTPMTSGSGNRVNPVASLIPLFYYHQVLKHCFSEFGYFLEGDILKSPQFQKAVIANNFSPLKQRRITLLNLDTGMPENDQYTELPTEINPANHLPDITIKDFLNDFMIKFGAAFDIIGNHVYIKQLTGNSVLKANANQSAKYIKLKADAKNVRLYYNYSDEERELYPSEIIQDFKQGTNVELSPKLRPVWQGEFQPFTALNKIYCGDLKTGIQKFGIENYGKFLTPPFSSLPEDAELFVVFNENTEEPKFPLLMGFYYGLTSNASSQVFPYMSHDHLRHNISNDVIGEWSLVWRYDNSLYGLVDKFLTKWLLIMNSTEKRIFYFNDNYLEYLENDWENFKIIGNQEYYIAKKRAQLPLRKEVEYECYKL